jgi:hypothetical protein
MSFDQELKDFLSGFQAGAKIANDGMKGRAYRDSVKMQREKWDTEKGELAKVDADADSIAGRPGNVGALPVESTSGGATSGGKVSAAPSSGYGGTDPDFIPKVIAAEGGDPIHVAEIIRNRAEAAGADPVKVVSFKGAFEPVSNGSWKKVSPEKLASAKAAWESVMKGGSDNLRGATHFYDADTQRKLGRRPPKWDDGNPVAKARGGNRRFFARPNDRFAGVLPMGGDESQVAALEEQLGGEEEATVFAAKGGMIESPMESAETDDYAGNDEDAGSNPAVRDSVEEDDDDLPTAQAAWAKGLDYLRDEHWGLTKSAVITPNDRGVKMMLTGDGAANPRLVRQIDQKIDPKGEMTAEKRAIARLAAVYRYHSANGNPQAAARAAAGLVLHAQQLAQKGGAIGAKMLQEGNVEGFFKVAGQGYSAVPDGKTAQYDGQDQAGNVLFSYRDKNGNLTERGQATIDQLYKWSLGMAGGSEFFRETYGIGRTQGLSEKDRLKQEYYQRKEAQQNEDRTRRHSREDEMLKMRRAEHERRMGGGASGAGAVPGAAGGVSRGRAEQLTTEEKEVRAEDRKLAAKVGGNGQRGAIDMATPVPTDPNDEGAASFDWNAREKQKARDEHAFTTQASGEANHQDVDAALTELVPKGVKLSPDQQYGLRTVASALQQGNDLLPQEAAQFAHKAVKEGVRRVGQGRFQIGNSEPMLLSPQAVTMIAKLRGENGGKPGTTWRNYDPNKRPAPTSEGKGALPTGDDFYSKRHRTDVEQNMNYTERSIQRKKDKDARKKAVEEGREHIK